jgi:hypothetical protein
MLVQPPNILWLTNLRTILLTRGISRPTNLQLAIIPRPSYLRHSPPMSPQLAILTQPPNLLWPTNLHTTLQPMRGPCMSPQPATLGLTLSPSNIPWLTNLHIILQPTRGPCMSPQCFTCHVTQQSPRWQLRLRVRLTVPRMVRALLPDTRRYLRLQMCKSCHIFYNISVLHRSCSKGKTVFLD